MERIIFFSGIISIILVNAEASCWGVPGKGKIFARKTNLIFCSFVSLFVWGFSSHSRIFHPYGDITIVGEGLQILTYARH